MKRITLLRHGKPAFELMGNVRGRDLWRIAKSYDSSGIQDRPPEATLAAVLGSQCVVCSHLPRSIESAKALGCSHVHVKDALFRETALPYFDVGVVPLPIVVWVVVLRLLWLLGYSKNGESLHDARQRAKLAAARLVELTETHQSVLLVGHGVINHFIAKELQRSGWVGPSAPGRKFWDYGTYERRRSQSAASC